MIMIFKTLFANNLVHDGNSMDIAKRKPTTEQKTYIFGNFLVIPPFGDFFSKHVLRLF